MTKKELNARLKENEAVRVGYLSYGAEWLRLTQLPWLSKEEIHLRAEEEFDNLKLPDRESIRSEALTEFQTVERVTSIRSTEPWSYYEDSSLRTLYASRGTDVKQYIAGRSRSECAKRAMLLGLVNRSKWTDKEIKTLIQNVFSFGVDGVTQLLPGRSKEDCQKVVNLSTLPGKEEEWTPEEKMILRLIVKKYDSEVYIEKAVALIPTRTKNECVAQLLKMEKRQGKKPIRDEAASNLFANELLHALNNGTELPQMPKPAKTQVASTSQTKKKQEVVKIPEAERKPDKGFVSTPPVKEETVVANTTAWTADEDTVLKTMYPIVGIEVAKLLPIHSEEECRARATELAL